MHGRKPEYRSAVASVLAKDPTPHWNHWSSFDSLNCVNHDCAVAMIHVAVSSRQNNIHQALQRMKLNADNDKN